jgi:hypothetical protein
MAHYAFLDENNIVTEVITGKDEGDDDIDWEEHYGNFRGQVCKRTSYNTIGGVHTSGGIPFRKNFACIGYCYDESRDAFIPPQPFSSWLLDEQSCQWLPPVAMPEDGRQYTWDEDSLQWVLWIPPQPHPSWQFDDALSCWQPPVPFPDDGNDYDWDESTTSWVLL